MKTTIKSILAALLVVFAVSASAQHGGKGGMRDQKTPEDRAKFSTERMTENLKLNKKQAQEVYEINLEMFKGFGTKDFNHAKAMEVRAEKLKKVLTSKQYKKHEEMMAQMKKQGGHGNHGKGGAHDGKGEHRHGDKDGHGKGAHKHGDKK